MCPYLVQVNVCGEGNERHVCVTGDAQDRWSFVQWE